MCGSTTGLVLLAMELAPMVRALREWEPVGIAAEQVIDTLQDHDGLTEDDVRRLRAWARRWQRLPALLRSFYAEAAPAHQAVSVALWHVLQGVPADLAPHTMGAVHQLFRDYAGHAPPCSLFPRVP